MPKVYGWEHIVYLLLFFAAFAGTLTAIKLKVKNEKTLRIIIMSVGGLLLAFIIFNRIAICFHKSNAKYLIPDSFCGVTSLCFAICALACKRDALPLHCLVYIAFWGGAITTFYPDFIGQNSSVLYPATISGLLHHGIAFYLSVLMVVTGYVKPCLKKFYAFPVGLCFMLCYGIFLIDALKFDHAMYIGKPLVAGTFLTWYVVAPMMIAVTLGGVLLYEFILKKKKSAPKATEAPEDGTQV